MVVYDCCIVDEILKFHTAAGAQKDISEGNMSFLVVSIVLILIWVIYGHETIIILVTTLCACMCLGYN